jgi:non-canonical purine NTP pyrophosphatase (RdgB/HAM1 family)
MPKNLTFITGNANKAAAVAKWLDHPIAHHELDLDEIQSIDLRTIVEHKAKQAFAVIGQPVLVEDVSFEIHALGRLPGPFIKWFIQELGLDGICNLLDNKTDRSVTVKICYGLYDGDEMHFFEAEKRGKLAMRPGGTGWGFENIFIPEGSDITRGEMDEETSAATSHRKAALDKLSAYLKSLEP